MKRKEITLKHTRNTPPVDVQRYNNYLLERLINNEVKEFKVIRTKQGVLFLETSGEHFTL